MTNDSPITRTARRHLDDVLCSLDPDTEPTPFVIVGGPYGMAHVGLHSLTDDDFDYTAGVVLPALVVVNHAVEVALVAFLSDPGVCSAKSECAAVAHWGPEGRSLSVAPVMRRRGQPPVIGDWRSSATSAAALDAVDDGVRHGTELAQRLRDSDASDLCEEIDLIRITAATEDDDVVPLAVAALTRWGWLD